MDTLTIAFLLLLLLTFVVVIVVQDFFQSQDILPRLQPKNVMSTHAIISFATTYCWLLSLVVGNDSIDGCCANINNLLKNIFILSTCQHQWVPQITTHCNSQGNSSIIREFNLAGTYLICTCLNYSTYDNSWLNFRVCSIWKINMWPVFRLAIWVFGLINSLCSDFWARTVSLP